MFKGSLPLSHPALWLVRNKSNGVTSLTNAHKLGLSLHSPCVYGTVFRMALSLQSYQVLETDNRGRPLPFMQW